MRTVTIYQLGQRDLSIVEAKSKSSEARSVQLVYCPGARLPLRNPIPCDQDGMTY